MSHLTPPVGPADHARGEADAPVTLVEYGDFECPYCGEFYPELKAVEEAMGGLLRVVFRNFPLTESHPHAAHAAAFAEAAAAQGLFWQAHDMLYEHQDALDDASLVTYGRAIGLDAAHVTAALEGRHAGKIREDFISGLHSGVNGTPCLFSNGQRYDGSRDAQSLAEVIVRIAGA
jgi:protein-disulfide isomerase